MNLGNFGAGTRAADAFPVQMYPRPWRYARISLYTGLETACVGPPERADERVSTEEKVSHMGASVPCNTSPTDGGDIRAADVQMKLTD